MANLKKVVSYIFSHPHRNRFKGTFTIHSSFLQSFRKTSSSILEVGCPPKTIFARPFHSTTFYNQQKLFDSSKLYMSEKVCEPTTTALEYTEKIKYFCESGLIYIAIDYLEEMVGKGFTPDAVTYTMVIDSLLNLACTPEVGQAFALKLFREMAFHHGILPDIDVTYTPLLHAIRVLFFSFTGLGFRSRTRKMISELLKDMMKDPRVYLDVTTFNIFVDAYCKEGRLKDAESLVELMIQRGKSPDIVTYKWIIDGYCSEGNVSKAREVFNTMMGRGVVPSVDVYHTLLDRYIEEGRMEDAESLIELMIQRGESPEFNTYSRIIYGYCTGQGNVSKARKVFNTMMGRGVVPGVLVYYTLLQEYLSEDRMEDAERFVEFMIQRGESPELVAYKGIIESYCSQGNVSKAREVFDSMRRRGVVPSVDVYNTLLLGYSKESKIEHAMPLFHEMMNAMGSTTSSVDIGVDQVSKANPAVPNECTYKIVLEGLCKNNKMIKASIFFDTIPMADLTLDKRIDLYNILIDGASKNDMLGMARYTYHDLTIKRLIPNAMTYAAMIHALCEKGLTWEAYGMFLLMKKKSFVPNDEIYYKLLKGFSKNKRHRDLVEMCIHELAGRDLAFDTSRYVVVQEVQDDLFGSSDEEREKMISDAIGTDEDEEDDNDDEIDLIN